MSNPFFADNNWLLITDTPVIGKSIQDFKPANLNSEHSLWGILREGPLYEIIVPIFNSSIKNLLEYSKEINDHPINYKEQNEILTNLKYKIDFYIENRSKPKTGYNINLNDVPILIDVRHNAIWDRPLSTMIQLYEILYNSIEKKAPVYLNMD